VPNLQLIDFKLPPPKELSDDGQTSLLKSSVFRIWEEAQDATSAEQTTSQRCFGDRDVDVVDCTDDQSGRYAPIGHDEDTDKYATKSRLKMKLGVRLLRSSRQIKANLVRLYIVRLSCEVRLAVVSDVLVKIFFE